MKPKLRALPLVSLLAGILLFTILGSCEKEPVDGFDEEDLNEFLKSLPPISSQMPPEEEAYIVSTEEDTTLEYIYHYDYYQAAAGFNEQIVLNPATDVIFPGALVKGESILDGTYTMIPAVRKPITISTSLTGSGSVSIDVEDPKLSTVREAINSLMNQEYDVPPANMSFTVEQAYSEQQIDLSLRASYKSGIVNVDGGFDFSNKQIKSRLVAKFIQNYYTLDMDLPAVPSDLFENDVDQALFGLYMPMYVSTVTYGRMALFTIESELEETEVRTYLNGSYANVDASASADFDALKEKSTMKVYILGGSGAAAGAAINGFEDFKNYIQSGGNYSRSSPGAPISYKLRYIRDNSIGKIVFSASYPIVTAIPRTDNIVYDINTFLSRFDAAADDGLSGNNIELYGNIYSWPASLGSDVRHDHLARGSGSYISVYETGSYDFTENTTTMKDWNGLNQMDTIMVLVNLSEVDDWPDTDDHYGDMTFVVPVPEIITSVVQGQEYIKTPMRVHDGDDHVDVSMRFMYQMRRLED